MQEQARLRELCVQNSLTVPTQVFEECVFKITPTPANGNEICESLSWSSVPTLQNENLARFWDFGFEFVQSTPPSPLPENENLARLRDFGLNWSR